MNDNQKNTALIRKVKELSAELEKSKLKVLTLETMIVRRQTNVDFWL
jgi:hypothetical protein